jgi:hypothetical protein
MGELVFLRSGKLGNALKEAKPKIAWADIAQKIRVKGLVLNLKRARSPRAHRPAPFRAVPLWQSRVCPGCALPHRRWVEPYWRYSFAKMAAPNKIMFTKAMNATVT